MPGAPTLKLEIALAIGGLSPNPPVLTTDVRRNGEPVAGLTWTASAPVSEPAAATHQAQLAAPGSRTVPALKLEITLAISGLPGDAPTQTPRVQQGAEPTNAQQSAEPTWAASATGEALAGAPTASVALPVGSELRPTPANGPLAGLANELACQGEGRRTRAHFGRALSCSLVRDAIRRSGLFPDGAPELEASIVAWSRTILGSPLTETEKHMDSLTKLFIEERRRRWTHPDDVEVFSISRAVIFLLHRMNKGARIPPRLREPAEKAQARLHTEQRRQLDRVWRAAGQRFPSPRSTAQQEAWPGGLRDPALDPAVPSRKEKARASACAEVRGGGVSGDNL